MATKEREFTFDSHNAGYVERLLEAYIADASSVPSEWRSYFDRLYQGRPPTIRLRPSFQPHSIFGGVEIGSPQTDGQATAAPHHSALLQERVDQLIRAYRVRGHLAARFDPLGMPRQEPPELDPAFHGLVDADLDKPVSTIGIGGPEQQTVRQLIRRLRATYCRSLGVQFMHIDDLAIRDWLQHTMERTQNRITLSREHQLRIFTRLTDAVIFEQFVRKKYVGAKTFSLEGAESLIPLLDLTIEKAASHGIEQIVIAMAHRGRLNVLANIIGKTPQDIFWEFEDPCPQLQRGRGDVKYHLGFSSDWRTQSGRTIHLSLCFNPSHLEFVNPVALGRTRAKQDESGDHDRNRHMALLIHGDAAFAAEGIVQETLNLSQLGAYTTGGSLHVVVNNQLGFTTDPDQARSTTYATDVARMLQIPIFHVNGEHPEAVAQAVKLAMDFRHRFRRDAVIDMYCYRRWGHSEGDEPSFTQPVLYRAIEHREPVRDAYLDHLLTLGGISIQEAETIAHQRYAQLERAFHEVRAAAYEPAPQTRRGLWIGYLGGPEPADDDPDTGVPAEKLSGLLQRLTAIPRDFHLHRKLKRAVQQRQRIAAGDEPVDWSTAEALALASLAVEGHRVRLTGQDTERGTFSQRHAVLHDVINGHRYEIFQHLSAGQARVEIRNSPLSEAGVLGFEYGYSLDSPGALVAWEAQFGDFWNAAQVYVDQFIAAAEDKWQRLSGLVLLLPHGFEGQGPEHSSARVERFLNLAAEHNLQIVWPSTPAQYYHCLRRQVKRRWRKPLVVLTPKSLLRHPEVISSLDELASGRFRRILPDDTADPDHVRRILLSSGKVYYDLLKSRRTLDRHDVALIRIEQLYPLPDQLLAQTLAPYRDGTGVFWVQEEPENMGAWYYWKARCRDVLCERFPFAAITRPASASPATGSKACHEREQAALTDRALAAGQ